MRRKRVNLNEATNTMLIPHTFHSRKTVSLALALIVSTLTHSSQTFTPALIVFTATCLTTVPVGASTSSVKSYSFSSNEAKSRSASDIPSSHSNITLLDLYPELREYLWKKALAQLEATTPKPSSSSYNKGVKPDASSLYSYSQIYGDTYTPGTKVKAQVQDSGWGNVYFPVQTSNTRPSYNYNSNGNNAVSSAASSIASIINGDGGQDWNSRGGYYHDAESDSSYNYEKEVLKHWYPFGSPEFYDSWKFKPSAPVPSYSHGWGGFPPYLEEEEHVSHDLSKDVSCLAGLLGLKTLKTLKLSAIFGKLKLIAISLIAFKLGVLLSPVAIPLLFPIIILVTVVKILPLILIIVLLLKILKKQVKIKKPFGKFLDSTGSLFFDDVNEVTAKVLNSDEECVNKISCKIKKRIGRRSSKEKKVRVLDTT